MNSKKSFETLHPSCLDIYLFQYFFIKVFIQKTFWVTEFKNNIFMDFNSDLKFSKYIEICFYNMLGIVYKIENSNSIFSYKSIVQIISLIWIKLKVLFITYFSYGGFVLFFKTALFRASFPILSVLYILSVL